MDHIRNCFSFFSYLLSHENGSDQLIVFLYTPSLYPSGHNLLIRTILEAHIVFKKSSFSMTMKKGTI